MAVIVLWQLPGSVIHSQQLDYVRAFDDPATRSIVIVAAFDAWSFAVIDGCSHEWRNGELVIEMRSKLFVSRNGGGSRIAAFRVPHPAGVTPQATAVVARLHGDDIRGTFPIEPLPAGFSPRVPLVDSIPRDR